MRWIAIIILGLIALLAGCSCEPTDEDAGGFFLDNEEETAEEETAEEETAEEETAEEETAEEETAEEETAEEETAEEETTEEETAARQADNYLQGQELLNASLDRAESDFRSQCFFDSMQGPNGTGELGLRTAYRFPVLADGHDITQFCSIAEELPFPGVLLLFDAQGQTWSATDVRASAEVFDYAPANGHGISGQKARMIEAVIDGVAYPIGQTYERNGQHISSIMLRLPTTRPAGQWQLVLESVDGQQQAVQFELPPCSVGSDVVSPIVTSFDFRFLSYRDAFEERIEIAGDDAIDNCRIIPSVDDPQWVDAEATLQRHYEFLGIPIDVFPSVTCRQDLEPGDYPVTDQDYGNIEPTRSVTLRVDASCPETPGVASGLTFDGAVELLWDAAGSPDAPLRVRPDASCVDGESDVIEISGSSLFYTIVCQPN